MTTAAKPCPFCGSYVTSTTFMPYHDSSQAMVAVSCGSCRARGPHAFNEVAAVDAWQNRSAETDAKPSTEPEDAGGGKVSIDKFGLYIAIAHPEWERVKLSDVPLPTFLLVAAKEVVCVPEDGLGFKVLTCWANRIALGVHRDAQYTVPSTAHQDAGGGQ